MSAQPALFSSMDVGRINQSLKLKESCDICSVSKIRCTKEKTGCSRCNKLGYTCFYSPSRRMGRPSQNKRRLLRMGKESRKIQSIGWARDKYFKPESKYSDNKVQASPMSDDRKHRAHELSNTATSFDLNESPNFQDCAASKMGYKYSRPTGQHSSQESSRIPQTEGDAPPIFVDPFNRETSSEEYGLYFETVSNDETEFFNNAVLDFHSGAISPYILDTHLQTHDYSRRESYSTQQQMEQMEDDLTLSLDSASTGYPNPSFDKSSRQASSGDEVCSTPSNITIPRGSLSEMLLNGGGSDVQASEYDCTSIATDCLRNLSAMSMERRRLSTKGGREPPTLNSFIDVVLTAVKHVLTIFACPCSLKVEVGLLTAAVSSGILDAYGTIISETKAHSSGMAISVHDAWQGVGRAENGGVYLQEKPEEGVIRRVLQELPRVENLVMRFAEQYSSDEGQGRSPEYFPLLASELKVKLEFMNSAAINWLA